MQKDMAAVKRKGCLGTPHKADELGQDCETRINDQEGGDERKNERLRDFFERISEAIKSKTLGEGNRECHIVLLRKE